MASPEDEFLALLRGEHPDDQPFGPGEASAYLATLLGPYSDGEPGSGSTQGRSGSA